MSYRFELGEIVWAKMQGQPWWPAIVTKLRSNGRVTVLFFGDNSKFLNSYSEPKSRCRSYANTIIAVLSLGMLQERVLSWQRQSDWQMNKMTCATFLNYRASFYRTSYKLPPRSAWNRS